MRGVFVTGTGTEVGKTVVAAVIAHQHALAGERVAVFKPVVSGLAENDEADHELLRRAAGSSQRDGEISPYRYDPPVSPHLAAELAGEEVDPALLRERAATAADGADALVCEGVGGFLVPLRGDYLLRDFARDLGLPVVVAAPPGLGTINHTLLTVESVRTAGLEVASVVLTPWPERPGRMEESNLETISALGGVPVETLSRLNPAKPQEWPTLNATTMSQVRR